ncbi:MAG: response regulator [Acetobacteraceae bacterium]
MNEPPHILLIEDHPIVRDGCRRLLEEQARARVSGAPTAAKGLRLCCERAPDLVILDLGLSDGGGLATLRRMLAALPALRVLVFSMHEEPVMVAGALEAGRAATSARTTILPHCSKRLCASVRVRCISADQWRRSSR